jgi:hypothetical protein
MFAAVFVEKQKSVRRICLGICVGEAVKHGMKSGLL